MYYISAVIDRIEGNFAVLRTFDYQEILWSLDNLPKNLAEGSAVNLIIKNDKDLEEEQQKIAQMVLEKVFNGK